MLTKTWRKIRLADGKYNAQIQAIGSDQWETIPGMVLGGSRRYVIQLAGQQWPTVRKTLGEACGDLVSHHYGLPVSY